jgi:nucleotide-binding universal stress UspA family protein
MSDPVVLPKKLLLAVDSQGACEDALHAGLWLARVLPAELECVHAFPPRPILWGKASQAAEWEAGTEAAAERASRALAEFAQRAPAGLGPLPGWRPESLCVRTGHAAAAVLEEAHRTAAGLLLLGRHSPRRGMDFGSTARGVLSKAVCPVWIQPGPAREVRRILVPTDLSTSAARALDFALALAGRIGARVTALHVFDPPTLGAADLVLPAPTKVVEDLEREARRSFEEGIQHLRPGGGELAHEFVCGNVIDVILGMQEGCDLVVMGSHGHTAFAAALLGSVTHAVARALRTPLLVVPDRQRRFLH